MPLRPVITNQINVPNTISQPDNQECSFLIEKVAKVFSYKCCEVEDDKLRKGGDYVFTFTFGNMGECPAANESLTDSLTVENVGGVQLELRDYCELCGPYDLIVGGCFYNLSKEKYENKFLPIWLIEGNYELVVCPNSPINFYVFNYVTWDFEFTIPEHSTNDFTAIFQVEDIFCEGECKCPAIKQATKPTVDDLEFTKADIIERLKAETQAEIERILLG